MLASWLTNQKPYKKSVSFAKIMLVSVHFMLVVSLLAT